MASSLRGYWDASARYQRFLYALAVAFLASAAFHTVVFVVDESPWAGPVSWRKPIEFAASFGLATASVAWILTFLPRRSRLGWALAAIWAGATVGETALITMQRWRGVPSHFNFATPFDAAVFGATGQLIIVVALVVVGLLLWSVFSLRADTPLRWAMLLGLASLVAGQLIGLVLLNEGFAQAKAGLATSPITVPPRGVLTLPHAVALHGLQVIPFLAWLGLFTTWAPGVRLMLVLLGATGYAGLVAITLGEGLGGRALFENGSASLVLLVCAAALLAAFVATLVDLTRGRATVARA